MRQVSGRFEVTGITAGSAPGPWTITGNFFDGTGNYGPGDVAVGMGIYLYDTVEGTIRYRIQNISVGSNPMTLDVTWDDTPGTEIDPPFDSAALCAINPTSDTPEEPSYLLQLLAEELISGLRAQTNRKPIETLGWRKFTFSFSDFATSATVNQIPLFDLGPNVILEKAIIKHNDSFTGGAISAYTVEVGTTGTPNLFVSAWDVFQAPGDSVQLTSTDDAVMSFSSPSTVYIEANATGDNLDQATVGDLYVLVKLAAIQE